MSSEFKKVLLGKAHCRVGKSGITKDIIHHIENLLKKHKIIKVKVLRSYAFDKNIESIAKEIAEKSRSYLQDVRGKTFILSKNRIK
ncbi:MAG: YhbY family RNA-binding protein [Promethearchaeia archaeon]